MHLIRALFVSWTVLPSTTTVSPSHAAIKCSQCFFSVAVKGFNLVSTSSRPLSFAMVGSTSAWKCSSRLPLTFSRLRRWHSCSGLSLSMRLWEVFNVHRDFDNAWQVRGSKTRFWCGSRFCLSTWSSSNWGNLLRFSMTDIRFLDK